MAKKGGQNEVGELSVAVTADVTGAVEGLGQVKREMDGAAKAADRATGDIAKGFGKAGEAAT